MRKTLRLAKREYKAAVKTKGFIIGLILAPIMMSGGLIAFLLLKDRVDTTDKNVAIVDRTGVIAEAIVEAAEARNSAEVYEQDTGKKVKPAYLFEIVEPQEEELEAQRLELSDRVRSGKLHAFVVIGPDVVHPGENQEANRIAYHAKNAAMDDLRGWINWPINNHLRKLRLADAGIDESAVRDLFFWASVEGLGLVSVDKDTGTIKNPKRSNEAQAMLVPIAMMMLMFMMVMMSVPGLLHSVMEEKTQRIAEVLLGSIKPFEFMMGKVLGGIAVSLTSSLVYVIGGIIAINRMGLGEYVPYHMLPWFFIYMIFAVTMLGAMAATLGSTCSEAKDAQSLTFVTIMPAIIPMFVYVPIAKEPLSSFATWMSLFPTFTPLLMLLRQSTPVGVPLWQPLVGLIGILVFTVVFVWIGGRIFRVGILMQGTPPKLSNIIRWGIRG
jgi:ABC-2 type transport system permease protein